MAGKTLFVTPKRTNIVLIIVLVYLAAITNCTRRKTRPSVRIPNGKVRGVISESREGREYFEFLGIPYARPPVGELRFEFPKPADHWEETLDASRYKSECVQLDVVVTGRVQGLEDCLYLNVFTPELKPTKLLPVMVYLHGGFFMAGSADMYRGKYFMDEDIVLITLNYRLGALGFLSTGNGVVRGNMGLRDQIMALKWVQQSIDKFGGDPSSVTLFGESAGAACVQYLMLSPLSKGLFHKGISQSGTATRKYLLTDDQSAQAEHFATQLGCPTTNSSSMINCLRKASPDEIVRVHREAVTPERNKFSIFGPVVEIVKDSEAVLPTNPSDILKSGNFNRMPWLAGVNSGEGLMYVAQILRDKLVLGKLEDDWDLLFPKLLRLNPIYTDVPKKVRQYYFGKSLRLNIQQTMQNFTDMFSDRFFYRPTKEAAELQAKYAPVYLYYFSHKAPVTLFDLVMGTSTSGFNSPELQFARYMKTRWLQQNLLHRTSAFYGACHGDELSMIFNTHRLSEIKKRSRHYALSRAMVKLWTDFARDESKLSFHRIPWKPISLNDPAPIYMEINKRGRIIYEPFTQRVRFWDSLNIVDSRPDLLV